MTIKNPRPAKPRASVKRTKAATRATAPASSDKKELERMRGMLDMLFDRNPDGVAYCDEQGNLFLNQTAKDLLNTDSAQNTNGIGTWSDAYGLFLLDGKTVFPPEELPLARALRKREVVRDVEMICKSPKRPAGVYLIASATPMPNGQAIVVFRDITERKRLEQDLEQRNGELAAQMRENTELIDRLRLAVDELSTPVLELWDDILALPVVGVVDTVRSSRMMEKVLSEVVARRCRSVILDVTGVDVIDTSTADRFIRIAHSIELLGAECVISGVQPAVAQTLTDLGVSFRGLVTKRNLKRALDYCISRQPQQSGHRGNGG